MSTERNTNQFTRRDFLRVGGVAAGAGLSLAEANAWASSSRQTGRAKRCIFIMMVGGPSHLDTWDPKPNAPDRVRGPFQSIQTGVAGTRISELFPRMAQRADRFSLIRSLHHNESPIHETGFQLLQTGRLSDEGREHPHFGSVLSYLRRDATDSASLFAGLPAPIGNTGVSIYRGQSAGFLEPKHQPQFANVGNDISDSRYGNHTMGRMLRDAERRLVNGADVVVVNQFQNVYDNVTWDCHADGASLNSTLDDYKETLCPMFDQAFSALLDDLGQTGLLDETLVVATGEFGRTPYINANGGRDHWPGVWSAIMAGGGIRGGVVVGSSDRSGSEPKNDPITPAQFLATIYSCLGVDRQTEFPGPDKRPMPVMTAAPIAALS